MVNCIFLILNCTWGILQTVVGTIVFTLNYRNNEHFFYKGVIVTRWSKKAGLSLGLFIFVPPEPKFYNREKYSLTNEELQERLMIHEYGHSVQSLILGPFYLFVIGITSSIWALSKKYKELRKKNNISYFHFLLKSGLIIWAKKLPAENQWRI